ncbi:hypothetical protein, partial [Alloprevotella tannerae]|uniref:hypothetical protein n=1 Tax=Alloprevotella tannerae TaxID=76122 RepID=UPI0028EBD785
KLFLLLLHKSLWNSFKDRLLNAKPNAKALESECKSRTKIHCHQTHNKLFYPKTKIISEMAKFDMQKWQNTRKTAENRGKKGAKKVGKQGFLRRKICCRLPKTSLRRLKIRPRRAEMEKIFPKLRPNGATKPFLPPKTAPPLPRIKMPYIYNV